MTWVWLSLRPGTVARPRRSMSNVPVPRRVMISRSSLTATNKPLSTATAVAVGFDGSSVVIRPLNRIVSVTVPLPSLKEVDKRGDRLLWPLFQYPMAGVLEDDNLDVRGDEFRLCAERSTVRLLPADRKNRDCNLGPRQFRKVHCGLREGCEIGEAGGHPAWPRILDRVRAPIGLGNRARLVGGEIVPEVFEVDAFATLHQRFRRRAVETEMPDPGVVVDRPPLADTRQESVHERQLLDLLWVHGGISVGDHQSDVVPHNLDLLESESIDGGMNALGGR